MAIIYIKMQKGEIWASQECPTFYRKLVAHLKGDGFKLNPYDPCVANRDINGEQMTACWHVDNLKVLHLDSNQVTIFGDWLSKKYGVVVATH